MCGENQLWKLELAAPRGCKPTFIMNLFRMRSATDEQLMRMDEKKLKDVKEESELHLGSASSS